MLIVSHTPKKVKQSLHPLEVLLFRPLKHYMGRERPFEKGPLPRAWRSELKNFISETQMFSKTHSTDIYIRLFSLIWTKGRKWSLGKNTQNNQQQKAIENLNWQLSKLLMPKIGNCSYVFLWHCRKSVTTYIPSFLLNYLQ